MKVGDLVEYKAPDLDRGIAVVTKVVPTRIDPISDLSYKVEVTWQSGQVTDQYNWQMKQVA